MKKLSLMLCVACVILSRLLPVEAAAAKAITSPKSTIAAAYKAYPETIYAGAAVYDPSDGAVIFGSATGNFFGDGRDIKVELVGRPMWPHEFTLGERPSSGEDVNDDVAYVDENGKIEDGIDIACITYYVRVTVPGRRAVQYGPEFIINMSERRSFKLCDVDGDGIPEIFFHYSTGTSAGLENAVAVSLKGGEFREIFNIEDSNPFLPVFETKLLPGFIIQLSAKSQDNLKNGALLVSMFIDRNKRSDIHYIFTDDGEPIVGTYFKPSIDEGFRHSGSADVDGDGRDEIFGAIPVNGSSNADDIAYINVVYKWENDSMRIRHMSITDIRKPLEGLPLPAEFDWRSLTLKY